MKDYNGFRIGTDDCLADQILQYGLILPLLRDKSVPVVNPL